MKNINLTLHCGGRQTTLDAVSNVATPEASGVWQPIPHIEVHNAVERSIGTMGLQIVNQVHALAKNGDRYFGMYQIAKDNPEMGLVLATRNSHDKEFVAGVAAGEAVFVCDNLAFHGEVVLGRRHTTNIMRDLPRVCDKAVALLADSWTGTEQRVAAYKAQAFTQAQVHDFICRSLRGGVITAQSIPRILSEWETPAHDEFLADGTSGWRLFNAYTEEFKAIGNPATLVRRSQILHGMMAAECGLLVRNN